MRERPQVRVLLIRPDNHPVPITVPLTWAKELVPLGWRMLGGENGCDPYDLAAVAIWDAEVAELERALAIMESRRRHEQWRAVVWNVAF
jgi:hypothetical protein